MKKGKNKPINGGEKFYGFKKSKKMYMFSIFLIISLVVVLVLAIYFVFMKSSSKVVAKVGNISITERDLDKFSKEMSSYGIKDIDSLQTLIEYNKSKIASDHAKISVDSENIDIVAEKYLKDMKINKKPNWAINKIVYPEAIQEKIKYYNHSGVDASVYYLKYDNVYAASEKDVKEQIDKAYNLVKEGKNQNATRELMKFYNYNNESDVHIRDTFSENGYPIGVTGKENTKPSNNSPEMIKQYFEKICKENKLCPVYKYENNVKENSGSVSKNSGAFIFAKRYSKYDKMDKNKNISYENMYSDIRVVKYED